MEADSSVLSNIEFIVGIHRNHEYSSRGRIVNLNEVQVIKLQLRNGRNFWDATGLREYRLDQPFGGLLEADIVKENGIPYYSRHGAHYIIPMGRIYDRERFTNEEDLDGFGYLEDRREFASEIEDGHARFIIGDDAFRVFEFGKYWILPDSQFD